MVARGGARWGIASERRRGVLGLVTSLAVGVLVATVEAQPGVLTREQVAVILGSTRDLSGKNLAGLDLSKLNLPPKGSDDIFKCKAPKLGDDEGMLQELFRCTGAKPSFRTRIRAGRELTVYSVPSRSAGFRYDHYWVRNGQVVEIETAGTR